MTSGTPIYNEMQKHYTQLQTTARIEARIELVKQLKAIKRPVKQVLDLIKEYEQLSKMNEEWLRENYPQPVEESND